LRRGSPVPFTRHDIIPGFSSSQLNSLASIAFVPVLDKHLPPSGVYFKSNSETDFYQGLFTYVDFGAGNAFLQAAGVKEQPSPLELANMLATQPEQTFETIGLERYLGLLRQLAIHFATIAESRVFEKLKRAKCLVGLKRKPVGDEMTAELALASSIVLIDDTVLQQIFNPLW
jgi:hypothetical protein